MKLKGIIQLKGHVQLLDAKTREVLAESDNIVVTTGQELTGYLLINAPGITIGISYCAFGTDGTAPADADTTLTVEAGREQITQKNCALNVITLDTFFTAAESTFHILEVGLFGHDASMTPDSGMMFSHALLDYDNSGAPRDLVINWTITITHP